MVSSPDPCELWVGGLPAVAGDPELQQLDADLRRAVTLAIDPLITSDPIIEDHYEDHVVRSLRLHSRGGVCLGYGFLWLKDPHHAALLAAPPAKIRFRDGEVHFRRAKGHPGQRPAPATSTAVVSLEKILLTLSIVIFVVDLADRGCAEVFAAVRAQVACWQRLLQKWRVGFDLRTFFVPDSGGKTVEELLAATMGNCDLAAIWMAGRVPPRPSTGGEHFRSGRRGEDKNDQSAVMLNEVEQGKEQAKDEEDAGEDVAVSCRTLLNTLLKKKRDAVVVMLPRDSPLFQTDVADELSEFVGHIGLEEQLASTDVDFWKDVFFRPESSLDDFSYVFPTPEQPAPEWGTRRKNPRPTFTSGDFSCTPEPSGGTTKAHPHQAGTTVATDLVQIRRDAARLTSLLVRRVLNLHFDRKLKVVVCDCDQTLWGGVLVEQEPDNLDVASGPYGLLQSKLSALERNAGKLICLASKNDSVEVIEEVFAKYDGTTGTRTGGASAMTASRLTDGDGTVVVRAAPAVENGASPAGEEDQQVPQHSSQLGARTPPAHDQHQGAIMGLMWSQIADAHVSWTVPKSFGIRQMAADLNLSLKNFLFIDDNPFEVAEVRTELGREGVMTLQVPGGNRAKFEHVVRNYWGLDCWQSNPKTAEQAKRTQLYRENRARAAFRKQFGLLAGVETAEGEAAVQKSHSKVQMQNLFGAEDDPKQAKFLAALGLRFEVTNSRTNYCSSRTTSEEREIPASSSSSSPADGPPSAALLQRISELSLRTNQMNTTQLRLGSAEGVLRWLEGSPILDRWITTIKLQDKFGDYGVVAMALCEGPWCSEGLSEGEGLRAPVRIRICCFNMSCRVLGRGVERYLLREVFQQTNAKEVAIPVVPTDRNGLVRAFLERLTGVEEIGRTELILPLEQLTTSSAVSQLGNKEDEETSSSVSQWGNKELVLRKESSQKSQEDEEALVLDWSGLLEEIALLGWTD